MWSLSVLPKAGSPAPQGALLEARAFERREPRVQGHAAGPRRTPRPRCDQPSPEYALDELPFGSLRLVAPGQRAQRASRRQPREVGERVLGIDVAAQGAPLGGRDAVVAAHERGLGLDLARQVAEVVALAPAVERAAARRGGLPGAPTKHGAGVLDVVREWAVDVGHLAGGESDEGDPVIMELQARNNRKRAGEHRAAERAAEDGELVGVPAVVLVAERD